MMKKTAIALGIASMAFGAQAIEVFKNADTAVEINIDMQFQHINVVDSTTNAQARNYVEGGGTQLQFKTSKIITPDLTVFGQIEFDTDPTNDDQTVITDDMKFGLKSKTMGTIQFGQFDGYIEDELMEIANSFAIAGYGGYSTSGLVTEPSAGNDGNHVMYSHKIGDFAFGVDFTSSANTGAATGATDGSNGLAYTVSYTLGGLKLVAGASNIARYKTSTVSTNSSKAAMGYGASYSLTSDVGSTKFAFLSATNTSYNATAAYDGLDTTFNMLSVVHTVGPWNLGVISSIRNAAVTSTTAAATYQEVGLQAVYDLGKGARLYVSNANFGISTGAGNFTEVGFVMSF